MTATSLLPPNASSLELALEAATARLGEVPVPVGDLWNPATCPLAVLPWLAWAVSVDVWDETWPEETKRAMVANSIRLHRRKGTRASIALSLAPLGLPATITEWFEATPEGPPGTFTVRLRLAPESPTVTLALIRQARAAIDRTRPVSRAYGLALELDAAGPAYVAGAAWLRVIARLSPHPAD